MNENIKKLAVDTYKRVKTAFSGTKDPNEVIREKLIEANGGSADFSLKHRLSHPVETAKVFALMGELIQATIYDGLAESSPLFKFVEYKNGADGDAPEFEIEDNSLFQISTIARGTQNVRRQRVLGGGKKTLIPEVHGIKFYEELPLIMSGKISWADLVDKTSKSYAYNISVEVCDAVISAANDSRIISITGTYDEDKLLREVSNVEMANPGKTARIFGTKVALRKISITNAGEAAKNDWYSLGYYGKFAGSVECIELKNAYRADGKTQVIPDDLLLIIATDDKFIKHYTEGDTLIVANDNIGDNADLTQDYLAINSSATGVVLSSTIAKWKLA